MVSSVQKPKILSENIVLIKCRFKKKSNECLILRSWDQPVFFNSVNQMIYSGFRASELQLMIIFTIL